MVNDLALKNIPDGWQISTLGEYLDSVGGSIQTGPFGSQLHASDYVEKGVPSVMPKNILVEGINQDDIARINEADVTRLSKYRLAAGDIIYSRRGDVEKCSLVTELESGWLCGTGCLRVRLGQSSSKVTPEFLHAYLSSPIIREWISRNAIGATMPNLNTGILRDVPFIIPDVHHAVFIGKSWKATNNKITLNRQINQTLEQMAQALFKSWFVDFDPVIDNALDAGFFEQDLAFPDELLHRAEARRAVREHGASLEKSKPLPDATRQLFPAAFEECAEPSLGLGGWVPQGWNVAVSGEHIDVRDGTHDSPKKSEHGFPLVTSKNLTSGRLNLTSAYLITPKDYNEVNKRSKVNHGDILLTMIGTLGIPCLVSTKDVNFAIKNIGLFKTSETPHLKSYFFELLKSQGMQQFLDSRAAGTTQKYLSLKVLRTINFVLPCSEVLSGFNKLIQSYENKIQLNDERNSVLANLRDTLLPKLVSGELHLDNIEADLAKEGVA